MYQDLAPVKGHNVQMENVGPDVQAPPYIPLRQID
jgi:hypothetical protein